MNNTIKKSETTPLLFFLFFYCNLQRGVPLLRLLLIFFISAPAACTQGGFIEPLRAVASQRSLAESITRLPCRYQNSAGERVVQVTWYKELRDGTKDQIITAHFSDGYTGR